MIHKRFLIIALCLPLFASAQKVALLDMNLKKPILYTDSVTVEQAVKLFPVGIENFDTLYADLDYLHGMLKKLQRSKMKSFQLQAGSTLITVKRVPFSNGDRYLTIAKTKIGDIESTYDLTPVDVSNASNASKIKRIMAYMKTNKDLFKAPSDVAPIIRNVVVVTE